MSSRRQARRTALVLLYQWDLTGQPLGSLYLGDIDPFALELARPVVENAPALDARITEAADDWTADRLGAVERNVLRLAVQELDTRRDAARRRHGGGGRAREALREPRCGAPREWDPGQNRPRAGGRR